ncbi:phosphotransferase [Leisingera sp. JC1]|uniref:phosphotransferase n=1 Tax=Leisingera sp. JC1 TaxID=1855282 RepID=UPI0009F48915|nr:phosphotransferase [Leisingera sp. JC1]
MATGRDTPLRAVAGQHDRPVAEAGNRRLGAIASTDAYFDAAASNLSVRPCEPEPDISAEVLKRHYGLTGASKTLSSEVERTVDVTLPDARRLILKTSTRPEAVDSFRFQSAAMAGLHATADVVAPQVLPTLGGALMFEADGVCGYLQTRIEGVPLHQATPAPGLLYRTGTALARLDLALAQPELPAADRPVLWNIGCWPRLLDLAQYLPSGTVADNVRAAMTAYVRAIEPQIADLAWQVTHNDPSPHNMIVTDRGLGFIDFGDGGWNPRIQDLAIAASHVVTDPRRPLGGAEYLIAGYASVLPLSELEIRLLAGLMKARQSALILVNYWRAELFPAEAEYIKKNVARAERGLSILAPLDAPSGEAAIRAACALPPPDSQFLQKGSRR